MKKIILLLFSFIALVSNAQSTFDYQLVLEPFEINGLPGLHSFAYAQNSGKWLLIGGRIDGLHARQPFNAFPSASNNTSIYVVDPVNNQLWQRSLDELPENIKEQLQSSNPNFFQDGNDLYYIGGYAFSATANDHITFNNLTAIQVPGLMDAIINNTPIGSYFLQISDTSFGVTGGHMVKMQDRFYVVGGHRFEGRYNPMGNPTYTQTYTNQIRSFKINNSGTQLSISNYQVITDAAHLHRRDYNLIPQLFNGVEEGYSISSGVFQTDVNLPYLYPVDITTTGFQPIESFNQYLCHYHTANTTVYEASLQQTHTLFFGGISQYYYNNGTLVQDDNAPFVKTISRLTRNAGGAFEEYVLPNEMPQFHGTSAEFLTNPLLPRTLNDIIKIEQVTEDSILLGYIVGGIHSASINPFSGNQTSTNTSASSTHYRVKLIRNNTTGTDKTLLPKSVDVQVYPNPSNGVFQVAFDVPAACRVVYYITGFEGALIQSGSWSYKDSGVKKERVRINTNEALNQQVFLTLILDNKYYVVKTISLMK